MPTVAQLRHLVGASRTAKPREVVNRAIRAWVPDGAQLLQHLQKADYTRYNDPTNPHLIAEVNRLQRRRAELADAILAGRITGPAAS